MSNFYKRKIFVIGIVSVIGIAWLLSANTTQAATAEELSAQIADLQAQIAQLRTQLAELQPSAITYEGIPAGFTFENNLKYGMRNNEVKYLQIILKAEGVFCLKCSATGYFGYWTKIAVITFQKKYASEILTPLGLTKGTGFVGKTTRAKLNQLLGEKPPSCIPSVPSLPSLLSPADGATNQSILPTLSWQTPSSWGAGCPDEKRYRIQIDNNSDFSSPLFNTTVSSAQTSSTISASLLSYNTTYYWRVRAENNAQHSDYSTRSFRTLTQAQPDFSLSVSPSSGTVTQGNSISTTVTATSISDFNQSVSFSASGLPTGASASFSPTSCNPTCSSTVAISTVSATPTGTYSITITGSSGGLTRTATFTLTVTVAPILSVSLSADPSSVKAPLDVELTAQIFGITTGPANYIFYCNRSDSGTDVIPGYNKRVNYVFSSSYSDICNYSTPGTYTAKVIVERGGLAAESRVAINVVTVLTLSVSLSANPSSGNAPLNDADLTAQVSGTATGPINYTFYCNRSDSGTNITPGYAHKKDGTTLNPYTILDICDYSTAGTYTAKVIVERGTLVAENRTIINVTSPTFDFSLSVSPASGSADQGDSVSATVTVTLISGTPQLVSFSATGLPSGANASFNPTSCNPSCLSTMTIETLSTTPVGTYSITISGSGGGLIRTTAYSLTVNPSTPPPTVVPKVLAVFVNPREGNRSLSGVYDGLDGDALKREEDRVLNMNINFFRNATEGVVNYQVIGRKYIDTFPPNRNGFRFTIANFEPCTHGNYSITDGTITTTCEEQKWQVDYDQWINDNNICEAVDTIGADEIWLFSKGFVMTWESSMMSPGPGFWVNGPIHNAPRCKKPVILQACFYPTNRELNGECYGHRVEGTFSYITMYWKDVDKNQHLEKFANLSRYSLNYNGNTIDIPYTNPYDGSTVGCGNAHFPVNGGRHYDYSNLDYKDFNCKDWLNFPNYTGITERINCGAWGCTNSGWQAKWLGSIPRSAGTTKMTSNTGIEFSIEKNWWYYLLYPERAIAFVKSQIGQ